jgi:hypothetical protein
MSLPGLKECISEMELIGGRKMVEKPTIGKIEVFKEEPRDNTEENLKRWFTTKLGEIDLNIAQVLKRNSELEKENQQLRSEREGILKILGVQK